MTASPESLAARIAFWRRAEMSSWEFERRVTQALRAIGVGEREESGERAPRSYGTPTQRAARDEEIIRMLNGPVRKRGDVQRLADKFGLTRERVSKIAREGRE